jgi:hypothetical protein
MISTTARGLDGRVMSIMARRGHCSALASNAGDSWSRCDMPATHYHVEPGGDREIVSACRCAEHGGPAAALKDIRSDWHVLAPLTVRDVIGAGSMALSSPERIVRIMREADEILDERWDVVIAAADYARIRAAGHRWPSGPTMSFPQIDAARQSRKRLVELHGVDSEILHRPAGVRARPRPWIAQIGVGSFAQHVAACATVEEAVARGIDAWRENLARRVAEIRAARGGTLKWGLPIEPAEAPRVIESLPGESSWDTYSRVMGEQRR